MAETALEVNAEATETEVPVADAPAAEAPAAESSAQWPDDWRLQMSGGDEKQASRLERYIDPAAVGKSFFEKDSRISAGDALKPLPEDATEDDVKAFREQQGLPQDPKGYIDSMASGLSIGEEESPLFESFAEAMHGQFLTQSQFDKAAEWYSGLQDAQQTQLKEYDANDKQAFEDAMRLEWGADYRANLNVVHSLLDANFTADAKEALMNGRGPDGTALLNNQDLVRSLVSMGRMMNPLSTVLPAGEDNAKGLSERKAEIEKFMRTNRDEYNKDVKIQDEYRELIEAELRSTNAA